MAFGVQNFQESQIQWEWAQPGVGQSLAETHCSICFDQGDERSILAHRINAQQEGSAASNVGHRVHRACLLKNLSNLCPLCRAPYEEAEIPASFAQRIVKRITGILSEGKHLGIFISINFFTYALGGLAVATFSIGSEMLLGLVNEVSSPALTAQSLGVGAIFGSFVGAASASLIGDVSLYAATRIIVWANPRNPKIRKVLFIAAIALAATASIYVASHLLFAIEAQIVARLAPESQVVYSYLMGKPYTGPNEVPHKLLDAALFAYGRVSGITFGTCCAFVFAFYVKKSLQESGAPLSELVHSWMRLRWH